MVRERKHTGEPRALPLPVRGNYEFCKQLYEEGLGYNQLPREIVERVGTNTSFLLHDYPQREGRWISIHFREGLKSFDNGKTPRARAEDFLTNLGADLYFLAERLLEDLGDVDMIYGLSQVSAKWGKKHSFGTKLVTEDPEFIRMHIQSIKDLPSQTNGQAPLTRFAIGREAFIQEFYKKDLSDLKALVLDLVGNYSKNYPSRLV